MNEKTKRDIQGVFITMRKLEEEIEKLCRIIDEKERYLENERNENKELHKIIDKQEKELIRARTRNGMDK